MFKRKRLFVKVCFFTQIILSWTHKYQQIFATESAFIVIKLRATDLSIHPDKSTDLKAIMRGSSFCSSSRPYLQNEDPIDFASVGV